MSLTSTPEIYNTIRKALVRRPEVLQAFYEIMRNDSIDQSQKLIAVQNLFVESDMESHDMDYEMIDCSPAKKRKSSLTRVNEERRASQSSSPTWSASSQTSSGSRKSFAALSVQNNSVMSAAEALIGMKSATPTFHSISQPQPQMVASNPFFSPKYTTASCPQFTFSPGATANHSKSYPQHRAPREDSNPSSSSAFGVFRRLCN